jgi:hypothetical protein
MFIDVIHKRTDLSLQHFIRKYSWYRYLYFRYGRHGVSHPVFRRIPGANYMCAQDVHMTHRDKYGEYHEQCFIMYRT